MKENQRVVVTKRMLKESMLQILKTKSVDKITVSELCLNAGINRATFYRHYEYPKDVLLEIQSDFFKEMLESFNRTVQPPLPIKYIEAMFSYVKDNAELVRTFLKSTSDIEFLYMFNRLYETVLSENGLMAALDKYDEDKRSLVFAYLSGGAYYFLKQWLLTDMKRSPAELAEIVIEIFNPDLVPKI